MNPAVYIKIFSEAIVTFLVGFFEFPNVYVSILQRSVSEICSETSFIKQNQ